MGRRYTTTLMINEENEATVSFSVAWGSPESGRSGPPENYDPGSDSVVEAVRVEMIDGLPLAPLESNAYAEAIEADADQCDELLAYAEGIEADEYERAMEARGEREEAF